MSFSDQVASQAVVEVSDQCEFIDHVLPKVQSLASWRFRRLNPCDREEAIAVAAALAWLKYQALIMRGKDPVKFSQRFAVVVVFQVCEGRQVGSSVKSGDLHSRVARRRHGLKVERLGHRQHDPKLGWRELVAEDRKTGPAATAAARLDISDWLSRMTARRRRIAEALGEGNPPMDVAREFRLSRGRISQLRESFRKSWMAFQGE